jgi:non-canonical purine NTP pyrophosphatase (RdgB/HAM1 family)
MEVICQGDKIIDLIKKTNKLDILSKMLDGFDDRTAYAMCCIGLCMKSSTTPIVLIGKCDGIIIKSTQIDIEQVKKAFGWDPIFQPSGYNKTFGGMTLDEIILISHRTLALKELVQYLSEINF